MANIIQLHTVENLMKMTKNDFSNSDFLDYNWGLINDIIDDKFYSYLSGEEDIEEMPEREFEELKKQIIEYLEEVREEMDKITH